MIPIKQTLFGEIKGNCFPASLASILEVSIESVPHFCFLYNADNWFIETNKWLTKNFGLSLIGITMPENIKHEIFQSPVYYMITGKSPRGQFDHCCVGYMGKLVHDPHPSNDGLETIKYYEFFVSLLSTGKKINEEFTS